MDSLTQIVLGASVAEASLGKKIGNKAIVLGAFAGTIPDLDIISRFFVDDLDFSFCEVVVRWRQSLHARPLRSQQGRRWKHTILGTMRTRCQRGAGCLNPGSGGASP